MSIYAGEVEKSVLSCMLMAEDCAKNGCGILQEDDFFLSAHKAIFASMQTIVAHGAMPDVSLLWEELQKQNIPVDLEHLKEIMMAVGNTVNFDKYVSQLKELRFLRGCEDAGKQLAGLSTKKDIDGVYALLEKLRTSAVEDASEPENAADILSQIVIKMDDDRRNGNVFSGIPTGFIDYDIITGGLQNGELTLLAARPSMGKTACAIDIIRHVARHQVDKIVLFFSLEMPKNRIAARIYCGDTCTDNAIFSIRDNDEEKWAEFLQNLSAEGGRFEEMAARIQIDDKSDTSIARMREVCHKMRSKGKTLGLVVVDYIQIMQAKGENREKEIASISMGLKRLAREFDCPVLALSQLSRNLESRADKRPILADLRESGTLEQDADVVAFLYRDEYYFPDTEKKGEAELIVRKNRNGPTGTVLLRWLAACTSFRNFGEWIPTNQKGAWE